MPKFVPGRTAASYLCPVCQKETDRYKDGKDMAGEPCFSCKHIARLDLMSLDDILWEAGDGESKPTFRYQ